MLPVIEVWLEPKWKHFDVLVDALEEIATGP
jgi:hypothetical protein